MVIKTQGLGRHLQHIDVYVWYNNTKVSELQFARQMYEIHYWHMPRNPDADMLPIRMYVDLMPLFLFRILTSICTERELCSRETWPTSFLW